MGEEDKADSPEGVYSLDRLVARSTGVDIVDEENILDVDLDAGEDGILKGGKMGTVGES